MPKRIQKRAAAPVDTTMSEMSPRPSMRQEGLVVITLLKPIGCISEVLIDPTAPAVSAREVRMILSWCSDCMPK